MPILRLLTLKCIETEDSSGPDSAYITVGDRKVWGPKDINDGQTKVINKDVKFSRRAEIRLYDEDDLDANDFLGNHVVNKSEAGTGEQSKTFTEDDAVYRLWYIVLPDNKKSDAELLEKYS